MNTGGILTPQSTATVPGAVTDNLSAIDEFEDVEFALDFIEKSTRYKEPRPMRSASALLSDSQ